MPKPPIKDVCCAGWLAPKSPVLLKALPAAGVLAAPNSEGVLAAVPPNSEGVLAAPPPRREPVAPPPPKSELLDAGGVLAAPNRFGAGVLPNRLGVDAAADAPNKLGAAAGVPNSDGVEAAGAAEAPNRLGVEAGVPNSDGAEAPDVLAAPQDAPGALGVANAMQLRLS